MTQGAPHTNLSDAERVAQAKSILGADVDDALLLEALTHRAYAHERKSKVCYERLEFMGDAVLDLLVSEQLLAMFPDADEGELSRRRAAFVSEPALAARAVALGIPPLMRLAKAQLATGDTALPSVCADVVEALLAAVYLQHGLEGARAACQRLLGPPPAALPQAQRDAKTQLQELLQAAAGATPTYTLERDGGTEHAPEYVADVVFDGHRLGRGRGRNKKVTTQAAAEDALQSLGHKDGDALLAWVRSCPPVGDG